MQDLDRESVTSEALAQMANTPDPRLREIMAAATRHLHDFAREVDLKPEEWLTGIAFLSHQAGSFLGAWGGGFLFDLMGSYDLAWKIGVLVGLAAGTMQLLMNDRPTDRVLAAQAQPA